MGDEIEVGITRPYKTGKNGSLIFVVLKQARRWLGVKEGELWQMKVDLKNKRIIYERIEGIGEKR